MLLVLFALLGILIVTRQPQNPIGWMLMLPALIGSFPYEAYLHSFSNPPPQPPVLLILAAWLSQWIWLVLIFPILFIPVLFPTGRPLTPRWRWVINAGLMMAALFLFLTTFSPDFELTDLRDGWVIANPIGFLSNNYWNYLQGPWIAGLIILTLLSLASIVVRYRRSQKVERQQIKWLLYACVLFAAIYFVGFLASNLKNIWNDIWTTFFFLGLLAIPGAIAIAILRYRLWDIDLLIRRTLQYSVLTGLLALAYFGSVLLGQRLAGALTGEPDSTLVLVVSTLLIAALFNPLRGRVQEFIDRRFFRRKYDAALILAAFTETARDETRLEALVPALMQAVQESVQPAHVGLWVRKGPGR